MAQPNQASAARVQTARRAQNHALRKSNAVPLPKHATPDRRFIAAAVNANKSAAAFIKAMTAHAEFAAGQPYDDAGHAEHHQRVVAARQAYMGAYVAFSIACHELGVEL